VKIGLMPAEKGYIMSERFQPSSDYSSTCAAIAFEVVQAARKADDNGDAIAMAKQIRIVYQIVRHGQDTGSDDKNE
jgi:hypothetical protein